MGGGSSRTTQTPDPGQQRINNLISGELQGAHNLTGGLPGFMQPGSGANYSPAELAMLQRIAGRADLPGMNSQEQQGLEQLRMASDPEMQVQKAKEYFNTVAGPQVMNSMTAMGYGRSGAAGEALGKGAAEMTMPVYQQAAQAQQGYGRELMGMGRTLEQREPQRLQTALEALGAPRQARYADEQRRQNMYMSLLGGMPMGGGGSQKTQGPDQTMNMIMSLASIAAMAAM